MGEILVTGATGRVGRLLVDQLRTRGDTVRALSRRSGPVLVTGDLSRGATTTITFEQFLAARDSLVP